MAHDEEVYANKLRDEACSSERLLTKNTVKAKNRREPDRTWDGVPIFLVGLSLTLSAFVGLRVRIGPAYVHPYLLLLVPLAWGAVLSVWKERTTLLEHAAVFYGLFLLSMLPEGVRPDVALKVGAFLFAVLGTAGMVKTRRDFRLGILGLAMAGGLLSIKGIFFASPESYGVNPFEEIANKNNFSMFSIPAAYAGVSCMLDREAPRLWRTIAGGCVSAIVIATLMSGNRSGWIGVLLCPVILVLARRERWRGPAMLLMLAYLVRSVLYPGAEMEERSAIFWQRYELTREGYASDDMRKELFWGSIRLGLANPIYGTSYGALGKELAAEVGIPGGMVGPHNLIGFLFGGCGIFVLAAFLAFGRKTWMGGLDGSVRGGAQTQELRILRGLILVWMIRGMFSEEVLYAPAFAMGIGLLIGAVWIAEKQSRANDSSVSRAPLDSGRRLPLRLEPAVLLERNREQRDR